MMLRDWRTASGLSLAETARLLGIEGKNPGGTLIRIETGMRQPEADMVERIVSLTAGAVSAADMHETRLAWLKENRPDKFDGPLPSAFTPPGEGPSLRAGSRASAPAIAVEAAE